MMSIGDLPCPLATLGLDCALARRCTTARADVSWLCHDACIQCSACKKVQPADRTFCRRNSPIVKACRNNKATAAAMLRQHRTVTLAALLTIVLTSPLSGCARYAVLFPHLFDSEGLPPMPKAKKRGSVHLSAKVKLWFALPGSSAPGFGDMPDRSVSCRPFTSEPSPGSHTPRT